MEASGMIIRGNVDSLVRLIAALEVAGIEMIDDGAISNAQGRGVRLKSGAALETLFRSAGREVTDRAPFSPRRRYGVLCKRRGSRKHVMPGSALPRSNANL
jgi:hypothetical protein